MSKLRSHYLVSFGSIFVSTFISLYILNDQNQKCTKCQNTCIGTSEESVEDYVKSLLLPEQQCRELIQLTDNPQWRWSFNTGNHSKATEFAKLFAHSGLEISSVSQNDIKEIDSIDVAVVIHKASQTPFDGVIIEDSSLDVEGANIGANLKWRMNELPLLVGKKATLNSYLAYRIHSTVFVFKKSVDGEIVHPRGPIIEGAVLNAYFQPYGSKSTLAENSRTNRNPRYLATQALASKSFSFCAKSLGSWQGAWQEG